MTRTQNSKKLARSFDRMDDLIYSVLDRLPLIFTQIYERLPEFSTLSTLGRGLYAITSRVPYLPLILLVLAAYVSLYTMYQTTRQAMRASSFMLRYGALFGVLLTGYNWFNNNVMSNNQNNAPGARGQSFWQSRPSRDYPSSRSSRNSGGNSFTSTLLNFINPDTNQDGPSSRD